MHPGEFQPSLRDWLVPVSLPSTFVLGYSQSSLRDSVGGNAAQSKIHTRFFIPLGEPKARGDTAKQMAEKFFKGTALGPHI